MKNLPVAVLATLFGISAASGIALTQAQHPGNNSGLLAATASIASADENERGNGRGKHNRNNNGNWQNGQCNNNGNWQNNGQNRGNGENDEDDNNQGNRGNGHGKKRGWQNPNNPHYCGNNGNGGNGNGQQGNSTLRGTITSVNGNQVTLMAGLGNFVTINDQPALNNQQTGNVTVGRYVTAYGYYQNGTFYATSLQ